MVSFLFKILLAYHFDFSSQSFLRNLLFEWQSETVNKHIACILFHL